jgi:arabinogalactan oligomer/maltooligosaccharide transport system substrate-binding protein
MKMAKRLLVLILVLMMAFASLAACSDAKEERQSAPAEKNNNEGTTETPSAEGRLVPEEGASLLVWESAGAELEEAKRLAEAFTAKYGVPVTVQEVEAATAVDRLVTDGPAGLGADLFAAPHGQLGRTVKEGLVLPNDVFADDTKENFIPAAVQGVTFEGEIYGYPKAIETYALFYNKDILSTPPATFDELIALAKTYNNPDENKYAFMWDVGNFYFSYGFLSGYGGYVFGENGTNPGDIGLNSAESVEGAEFIQSLKSILPLNTADINNDAMTDLFNEGKTAAYINDPLNVQGARDAGVNFGVAPLPILPNGEHMKSFSGIRAWYVSAYTPYPNAAKLFANFTVSRENLAERFTKTKQLPPRIDLLEDPVVAKDPIAKAFLEQAQYAVPMPSIPAMGNVWSPAAAALQTIWNDNADAQKTLDSAVQQIKDAIAAQK